MIITSHSFDETLSIGHRLGRLLKKGDVICLYGDLGSGKTMLCKGIASIFNIDQRDVTSPSYTIINEYNSIIPFYHIDLYRLSDIQSIEETGMFEYLNSESITVIEWADRLEGHVECSIKINLSYIDTNTRRFSIFGINEEDWNNCKD
jgi:tRNA threonylcarbamoyladenosine biosynthesis protein TsaE